MAERKKHVSGTRWDILTLSLALSLALSGCFASVSDASAGQTQGESLSAFAGESSAPADVQEKQSTHFALEEVVGTSELGISAQKGGSVLVFASDYQHRDGWENPPVTLNQVLNAVYDAGVRPNNYVFCGDYTALSGKNDYNADPNNAIAEIKSICANHDRELDTDQMIFVQGNHDLLTTQISTSGLHIFDDYLVYVLNTETEYPWGQGKYKRRALVQAGARRLEHCLKHLEQEGETRPIFLAGHVPLHFSGRSSPLQGTGDNVYASDLFQVINRAGEALNLVYLYGHNHSRGWDSYLGGSCVFRPPGDELLVPEADENASVTSSFTRETLTFTYMNAGYVGYFSSAGGEDALNCSVCKIWPDRMVFTRYDTEGVHALNSVGTPNPAKDDRALIGTEYYGSIVNSPYEVNIKGNTEQKRAA